MKPKHRLYCPYCGSRIIRKMEEDTPRDFCEACGIFFYDNPLPVVSSIVVSERKILLVKRGKKPYKGMWCLPTGFAEAGESIEEAALRELREETGIKGRIAGLVDVDSCTNYYYGDLLFVSFEAKWVKGTPSHGDDTVAAKFHSLDRIPRLAFHSNTKAIQAYIRNHSDNWAIADSFAMTIHSDQPRKKKKNLLSNRLIEIIEKNADRIVQLWIADVTTNRSTPGYHEFDQQWMYKGVRSILSQFGRWLGGFYRDSDIKTFYMRLGRGSKREGLALSEILSAISLIKKHVWEFALSRGVWRKTLDIYTVLELDRRIVIFFDKAAFYTTKGYEIS
ncbi:MAG: NUDIX hydrolase [Syntrophales bacterium]